MCPRNLQVFIFLGSNDCFDAGGRIALDFGCRIWEGLRGEFALDVRGRILPLTHKFIYVLFRIGVQKLIAWVVETLIELQFFDDAPLFAFCCSGIGIRRAGQNSAPSNLKQILPLKPTPKSAPEI